MSLFELKLHEIQKQLNDRSLSVRELTDHAFKRIAEVEPKVQAFLALNEENARETAAKLDEQLAAGDSGQRVLFGMPAGVKDNIVTENLTTTCASRYLSNYNPIYDATVVQKLKSAGSVIIGKLNMDEFAMGSSTETSAFHLTYNPWNPEYVPGGSSGGSAAAVAAGEILFSLGSDTGGSIRQPASFCGVVGLKPTYGLVSRYGAVAFASSLDQIGPLTRSVEDSAHVLQAIAGYDPMDSTSAKTNIPDFASALTGDIRGLRIAVPKEYMSGVNPQVKERIQAALQVLESLGAVCEEVSLPHTEYAVAAYYLLASSEASSNLARFDGIRYGHRSENAKNLLEIYHLSRSEGFGSEVKRRIMLGTFALSSGYYDAYYLKAQKVRTLVKQDFEQVFAKYDVIIGPTVPSTAFKIGEKVDDPITMYLNDILTIPVNLAGNPAISVPCGFVDGLPVGLQMIGKTFDESTILCAAHAFEQHTDHHKQRPQIL